MTDRELLELAAKAAFPGGFEWNGVSQCIEFIPEGSCYYRKWRPLEDDGDALRLADSLELDILHRVVGGTRVEILPAGGPLTVEAYVGTSVRLAATRRAIVRAAADMAIRAAAQGEKAR